MLYTVVSEYDIFLSRSGQRKYLDISGGKLEYMGDGKNRKIVGLFSTDPAMYLRSEYQPGGRIPGAKRSAAAENQIKYRKNGGI